MIRTLTKRIQINYLWYPIWCAYIERASYICAPNRVLKIFLLDSVLLIFLYFLLKLQSLKKWIKQVEASFPNEEFFWYPIWCAYIGRVSYLCAPNRVPKIFILLYCYGPQIWTCSKGLFFIWILVPQDR